MNVGDETYLHGSSNNEGSVRLLWVADANGDGLPDAKLQSLVGGAWLDMATPVVVPNATLAGQALNKGQADLARRLFAPHSLLPLPTTMASPPTITWTNTTVVTAITGSALVDMTDARFTWYGGDPVAFGLTYPNNLFYTPKCVTHPFAYTFSGAVEFWTDADKFEFVTKGVGSDLRIMVDGQWAQAAAQTLPNDGNIYYVLVNFGSSSPRRVRIEGSGAFPFGGVRTDPKKYGVWKCTPPHATRAVLIGDSFMEGTGASSGLDAIGVVCARSLGWVDARVSGSGGTGYLSTGSGVTFRTRIADVTGCAPDVVVITGGHNDSGLSAASIQAECNLYYNAIRAALPTVPVVVFGMWPSHAPATADTNTNGAISAAVGTRSKFWYVETLGTSPWITGASGNTGSVAGLGNADIYIGSDNVHPSPAGHVYYGRRMAAEIAARLTGFA